MTEQNQNNAATLSDLAAKAGISTTNSTAEASNYKETPLHKDNIQHVAIRPEMDIELYHQQQSYLSSSVLKSAKTPHLLKLFYEREIGNAQQENFNVGSAIHSLVSEPQNFEYRVFDDSKIIQRLIDEGAKNPRAKKEYKDWKAQYQDDKGNLGRDVISKPVFQSMWNLSKKMDEDWMTRQLLKFATSIESSYFCTFTNKLQVRIRPDVLVKADERTMSAAAEFGAEIGDILHISIKSTKDASPEGYRREAYKMNYHVAEAYYYDVLQAIYPNEKIVPVFLAVEKDKDNLFTGAWNFFQMTSDFLNRGRAEYINNLEVWRYTQEFQDFSPAYEFLNKNSRIFSLN